ncbi:hypothetical protein KTN05_16985, partial [Paracoccus sp. Z118]|nr:hypothetical protein [Paracoccus sp. Z118]
QSRHQAARCGNLIKLGPLRGPALLHHAKGHDRLEARLREPFVGRTFVVTHHGPHREIADPIDSVMPVFASNLDGFIRRHQPDGWLFGHTHRWLEARVGRTLIRNVSLGYPHEVDPQHERSLLLRGMIEDRLLVAV